MSAISSKAWRSWIQAALPVRQAVLAYAHTYGLEDFRSVYRISHELTPYLVVPKKCLEQDYAPLLVEIIVPLHLILVINLDGLRVAVRLEPQRTICRDGHPMVLIPYAQLDLWRIPALAVSFSASGDDWPEPGLPGYVVP